MRKLPLAALAAIATLAVAPSLVPSVHAGLLYNETFSTDGTLGDYTGPTKIFTATEAANSYSAAVAGGKLTLGLNSDGDLVDDYLTTYTSFGGAKSLVSLQLDYTVAGGSAATSGFQLYLGSFTLISDFNRGFNIYSGERNWAKLQGSVSTPISAVYAPGENYANYATTLGQTYTLTMFLNQSGSAQSFTGPGGGSYNLEDNSWSFFVGTTLVADSVDKGTLEDSTNLSGMIMNFGKNYNGGSSSFDVDNIIIRDDLNVAVPEPGSAALIGLGALAFLTKRRRR